MLHSERGFSLIELMIAIIIMSILIAMAAPSFSTYLANTRVRSSAESLLATLQFARSEAVRRNAAVEFAMISVDAISENFAAAPDLSGTNWIVRLSTLVPSADDFLEGKQATEGDASRRIVIEPNVDDIVFNGFGGANTGATFRFSNPSAGACVSDVPPGPIRCLNVVASIGGRIRMCDPAVTAAETMAGDTRGC